MNTTVILRNWLRQQKLGVKFDMVDLCAHLKVKRGPLYSAVYQQMRHGNLAKSGTRKVHQYGAERVVFTYVKELPPEPDMVRRDIPASVNDLCGVLDKDLQTFKEFVAEFFHSQNTSITELQSNNKSLSEQNAKLCTDLKKAHEKLAALHHLEDILNKLAKQTPALQPAPV